MWVTGVGGMAWGWFDRVSHAPSDRDEAVARGNGDTCRREGKLHLGGLLLFLHGGGHTMLVERERRLEKGLGGG